MSRENLLKDFMGMVIRVDPNLKEDEWYLNTNHTPQLPPSGARPNIQQYRVVTDERPWRPGPR